MGDPSSSTQGSLKSKRCLFFKLKKTSDDGCHSEQALSAAGAQLVYARAQRVYLFFLYFRFFSPSPLPRSSLLRCPCCPTGRAMPSPPSTPTSSPVSTVPPHYRQTCWCPAPSYPLEFLSVFPFFAFPTDWHTICA